MSKQEFFDSIKRVARENAERPGVIQSIRETAVERLLRTIEPEPREGLDETPARVAKAFETWFSGYGQDPAEVLKVFKDGAEGYDDLILETDIPINSKCEHHLADIFGVAHIAYIPNGAVVGLSKLKRLVDIFAHRLQIQERLTQQIASAIQEHLNPLGVGVVLQCRHRCMESRGIAQAGIVTTTSSLKGAIKDEPETRAEFLNLVQQSRRVQNGIL